MVFGLESVVEFESEFVTMAGFVEIKLAVVAKTVSTITEVQFHHSSLQAITTITIVFGLESGVVVHPLALNQLFVKVFAVILQIVQAIIVVDTVAIATRVGAFLVVAVN